MEDDSESHSDAESDQSSVLVDPSKHESMWDKILRMTYAEDKDFWYRLLNENKIQFQLKFKESFIEHCKIWLGVFNEFIENDDTWGSLMETKSKLYETVEEDDEESLFCAIDARRYKLFKLIDWGRIESAISEIPGDSESDNTEEAEEEINNLSDVPM